MVCCLKLCQHASSTYNEYPWYRSQNKLSSLNYLSRILLHQRGKHLNNNHGFVSTHLVRYLYTTPWILGQNCSPQCKQAAVGHSHNQNQKFIFVFNYMLSKIKKKPANIFVHFFSTHLKLSWLYSKSWIAEKYNKSMLIFLKFIRIFQITGLFCTLPIMCLTSSCSTH